MKSDKCNFKEKYSSHPWSKVESPTRESPVSGVFSWWRCTVLCFSSSSCAKVPERTNA